MVEFPQFCTRLTTIMTVYEVPSEKMPALKGKHLLPMGTEGDKTILIELSLSLESGSINR